MKQQLKTIKKTLLSLVIFTTFNSYANTSLLEEYDNKQLELTLQTGIAQTAGVNSDLMGVAMSAGLNYAILDKWAGGFEIQQVADFTGASISSSFHFRTVYAITGGLRQDSRQILLNGQMVFASTNTTPEGFRAFGNVSQYYFNGSEQAVPYAGMGGGAYYQKVMFGRFNMSFGGKFEQLLNANSSLTQMTIYTSLSLFF